ncbi:MAG: hypothetical protein LBU51_05795 [Bacteroidales bacterium]|jgi:hypothetical protein|nr:hypothetical protein [Bacteroidales bacterium]
MEQFQLEFSNMHLESKRHKLLVVRDILNDIDKRVRESLKDVATLKTLPNMPDMFFNITLHIKVISENDNPNTVRQAIAQINKFLVPARTFLSGFKEAAILILEDENIYVIEDNGQPE